MTWLTEAEKTCALVGGYEGTWSVVHKFGRNSSVGTTYEPICDSGLYRTPTSATALEFVSSSVNDTSAGSGAREITVIGLDNNWDEVSQTVTTNGTTAVALTTDLIRLYRWFVSSSGTYADQSSGSHAGTLTIRVSGAGATWSTISIVDYPRGQSQIGSYTIPNGFKGYVASLVVDVDANQPANLMFFKRENADDVTTPFTGSMRAQVEFNGVSGGRDFSPTTPLGPFPAMTDLIFMGEAAVGTAIISVDFEVFLERTA